MKFKPFHAIMLLVALFAFNCKGGCKSEPIEVDGLKAEEADAEADKILQELDEVN